MAVFVLILVIAGGICTGCSREVLPQEAVQQTNTEVVDFAWEADVADLHLKLDAVSDVCRNHGIYI